MQSLIMYLVKKFLHSSIFWVSFQFSRRDPFALGNQVAFFFSYVFNLSSTGCLILFEDLFVQRNPLAAPSYCRDSFQTFFNGFLGFLTQSSAFYQTSVTRKNTITFSISSISFGFMNRKRF